MTPNPAIMKSVEQLGYRVTVGEVAAQAGLEINLAQQGLLALASEAGGHLQVTDSGDIVYLFPQNFRGILRNKYFQLRLKETWEKIWNVLFYLLRISFGIYLIVSLLLIVIAIIIITIASLASRGDDDNNSSSSSSGGNFVFFPNFWFPDLFWIFDPGYRYNQYPQKQRSQKSSSSANHKLNFLESVFSFLFGDGNPNADLEERRWQDIGTVIRNARGAITSQQIAPFLDNVTVQNAENEDYILPVLARFNGYPQVSPQGDIIYYFPELQVSAKQRKTRSVGSYLRENLWRFSQASGGQITLVIGLGVANFVLALVLGALLQGNTIAQVGASLGTLAYSFVGFVAAIYWILLGYGTAFIAIPLLRYFWINWKNSQISERNEKRQARATVLVNADQKLLEKMAYARQFAREKVITDQDISYSTEQDLLEQDIERSDKIDQEWQRRLESGS